MVLSLEKPIRFPDEIQMLIFILRSDTKVL